MRRLLLYPVLGLLALAPFSLATAQPDPSPAFEPDECPMYLPGYVDEGTEIRCGYVTVPEYHAAPEGDTLRLAVAILPATGDDPAPDPLVYAAGGPGSSALNEATFPFFSSSVAGDLRVTRDIVLIEQRGTRYSEPHLSCLPEMRDAEDDTLDAGFTLNRFTQNAVAASIACHDRLTADGIDLSAYNSLENAADFPFVMSALGYDKYNLLGVSYGSVLTQHILRDHSENVRSVIMDSVVPLDSSFITRIPANADRAMQYLFDACAVDPDCAAEYPNLEATFFDIIARMNSKPLDITLGAGFIGPEYEVQITGDMVVRLLFLSLYLPDALDVLPDYIDGLARGDSEWVEFYPVGFTNPNISDGMNFSIVCAEDGVFELDEVQTADIAPEIAEVMVNASPKLYYSLCPYWDVAPLPDHTRQLVQSEVPVLMLSGAYDPITPEIFAQEVSQGLATHYAYTFADHGHSVFFGNRCAREIATDFLAAPDVEPDAACLAD
ncbi:MAG: alpha/beta fold hydrolase [Anaerolineales bacterium]